MRIITGALGEPHVTSNDDGELNQAIFGKKLTILPVGNKLAYEVIDNNTIRIKDGDLIMQGRHALINPNETEDVTIESATIGYNRKDLIVVHYEMDTQTGFEDISLRVLKGTETSGTPQPPEYTEGDIRTGSMVAELPLYIVTINSSGSIERVEYAVDNMTELVEPLANEIYNIKNIIRVHANVAGDERWAECPSDQVRAYLYEGADTAQYSIPTPYCSVYVIRKNEHRGTAIAIEWAMGTGRMWVATLHDTWGGWKEVFKSVPSQRLWAQDVSFTATSTWKQISAGFGLTEGGNSGFISISCIRSAPDTKNAVMFSQTIPLDIFKASTIQQPVVIRQYGLDDGKNVLVAYANDSSLYIYNGYASCVLSAHVTYTGDYI